MESRDAGMMDDSFFGTTAGPGPVVAQSRGKAKPSGQASSSAPVKTSSSQAGPSKQSVGGAQGKGPVGKDVKGKGKAEAVESKGAESSRVKRAQPPPFSASATASTSAQPSAKSAVRPSKATKSKCTGDKEGDDTKGGGSGSKERASVSSKAKKAPQPFPMSRPSSQVDSDSDDPLSQAGESPNGHEEKKKAGSSSKIPSQRSTTLKSSSQKIPKRLEPKIPHDPATTPRGPFRNRLHSQNHLRDTTTDSPDPIGLAPSPPKYRPRNRSDVFASVATLYTHQPKTYSPPPKHMPRRQVTVLVPHSSMSSNGENEPPQKRKRAMRSQRDDMPTDEDDATPGPSRVVRQTIEESKARKPRAPRVDDNGGTDFFAEMTRKATQERESEDKMISQAVDIEYIQSSQEIANDELQQAIELEDDGGAFDDFTAEELDYCAGYTEATNLCKYCDLPLPKQFSARLQRMKLDLIRLEAEMPLGTPLHWDYYDPFCRRHEAETTVIPLGIRAGFPADIDFTNLRPTLEQPGIRSRLEKLCADPTSSTFYNDTLAAIHRMGHTQWQKSEKILAASFPGYYGGAGLSILMDHFLALRKWKLLRIPGLIKNDPHNFIQTVLVPESAVMLIMVDRGWTGDIETEAEKRKEAMEIRAESWKYGHAAFPDIAQETTRRTEEKNWVIKYHQTRGLPVPLRRKKRKTPGEAGSRATQAIELSSDTGLSQSDLSELSASEASDARLGSQRGQSEDEGTDSENVLSRSTARSDVVSTPPFAGSSAVAIDHGGETDKDEYDMEGDTTIKMASQASTIYELGLDDDAMAAAADATEAAVRGRRGKSRG